MIDRDQHGDDQQPPPAEGWFVAHWLLAIAALLCAAILLFATGCVSQGEYEEVRAELRDTKELLVSARTDVAEMRACLEACLAYFEEDERRIMRQMLGGH